MKKIFFTLAILCLFSFAVKAQSRVTSKAPANHSLEGGGADHNSGFGIKAGFNYADVRGRHSLNNAKSRKTYHVGAYSQFSITNRFSVQPEVIYSRKGFEGDPVHKFDYIDVPLLFVYNFFDNVGIHVGPQASLLMTVKEGDSEINKAADFQSLDYGLVGGIEAKFLIFRTGARYNLGMREIYKDNFMRNGQAANDVRNGVFQVYVGVGFNN
jgi:hypothetical protein